MGDHALQAEWTFVRRGLQGVLELLQQLRAGKGRNSRWCHGGRLGPEHLRKQCSADSCFGPSATRAPSCVASTVHRQYPRSADSAESRGTGESLCSGVQARR